MSDVPRSLQSWVSTIHTVVLTADVFQLFMKHIWVLLCREQATKFLDPSPMAKKWPFSGLGKEARWTPRATSRPLDHGSTWYIRGRRLHSPALPDTNRVGLGFYVETYRRVSCFLLACWLFSTCKRKFRRVLQLEQVILEKQTFSSRVPHSGGTSVSSAGFFFE